MKAKVKATGEIVDVKPERDGFFIDEVNSNPYKFEDLEFFVDDKENQPVGFLGGMLGSLLNPSNPFDNMNKQLYDQFWATEHEKIIFKLIELFKERYYDFPDRLSAAMSYARIILNEMKECAQKADAKVNEKPNKE